MLYRFDRDDPAQLEAMLRDHADTEYHPCGTARMGPDDDPMAVVDPQLRVRGIAGLRVADASWRRHGGSPTIRPGSTRSSRRRPDPSSGYSHSPPTGVQP